LTLIREAKDEELIYEHGDPLEEIGSFVPSSTASLTMQK
jgi:hypothetical protein